MCALGFFIPMVLPPQVLGAYKVFVIIIFLFLYGFFLFFQVGSYSYFFTYENGENVDAGEADREHRPSTTARLIMLFVYLALIGVLVEFLSVAVDDGISNYGLPAATAALIVAIIAKAPETIVVMRATMRNDMQLVINIALSSALSTMGLTIPAILILGLVAKIDVVIALTPLQALLLSTTIILAFMNKSSGKTNAYGGAIQLSLFFAFLFTLFFLY